MNVSVELFVKNIVSLSIFKLHFYKYLLLATLESDITTFISLNLIIYSRIKEIAK